MSPEEADGEDEHGHEHGDEDDKPLVSRDVGLSAVSTNGGSPFAGFGAGLRLLDGDEARRALRDPAVPRPDLRRRRPRVRRAVERARVDQPDRDRLRPHRPPGLLRRRARAGCSSCPARGRPTASTRRATASPTRTTRSTRSTPPRATSRPAARPTDLRRAVFAYNHADWYVDRVLKTAGVYGSLPGGLRRRDRQPRVRPLPGARRGQLRRRLPPRAGRRRAARGPRASRAPRRATAVATQDVDGRARSCSTAALAGAFRHRGLRRRRARAPARGARSAGAARHRLSAGARGARAARARSAAPRARRRASRSARSRLPAGYGAATAGIGVVVEDALGNRYRYGGLAPRRAPACARARALRGGADARPRRRPATRARCSSRSARRAAPPSTRGRSSTATASRRSPTSTTRSRRSAATRSCPRTADVDRRASSAAASAQLAARVLARPGHRHLPGRPRGHRSAGSIDRRIARRAALPAPQRPRADGHVAALRATRFYTAGGSVSAHSFGAAVDIAAFNGQPVLGNQGPGSLTEQAVKLLMRARGRGPPVAADLADGLRRAVVRDGRPPRPPPRRLLRSSRRSALGRSGNALGSVDFDGGARRPARRRRRSRRPRGEALAQARRRSRTRRSRASAGAGALRVEAERPARPTRPSELAREARPAREAAPTAAGARVIDVDVPAGAAATRPTRSARSTGRPDAAGPHEQTVLARHRDGTWRVVGARARRARPDRQPAAARAGDRRAAAAATRSATGARWSSCAGSSRRALIASGGPRLNAVDVRSSGRGVEGFAVGAKGGVRRLERLARRARARRHGRSHRRPARRLRGACRRWPLARHAAAPRRGRLEQRGQRLRPAHGPSRAGHRARPPRLRALGRRRRLRLRERAARPSFRSPRGSPAAAGARSAPGVPRSRPSRSSARRPRAASAPPA